MAKRLLSCLLVICMLLTSGIVYAAPADNGPSKGEKEKMLTFAVGGGTMKVDVCAANTVYVRWAPGDKLPDKGKKTYTVDYDKSFNDFTVVEANNALTVTTEKLIVNIDKSTGKVTYRDAAGNLILQEGNRTQKSVSLTHPKNADSTDKSTYEIGQSFVSDDNEALYGFGNINNTMGIKGQSIEIVQKNTEKRTPMFYSNMGYGILFDVVSNGRLTWSNDKKAYTYTGLATDSMDYYFFYGPDADTVISGYRTVTGTATMLPKNAFGYVQSRNRYGSQKQLLEILNTFRTKKIPLDTLVIDYHWWTKSNGDRLFNSISAWDSTEWPDPTAMMTTLHNNHVSASISVWPTFGESKDGKTNEAYEKLKSAGFLLEHPGGFGYTYDPTNQDARNMYWGMINDTVFSTGMDSIWLDADEPENGWWVDNSRGDLTSWGDTRTVGAMYPLLTNQGVYEGQRAISGNEKRVNTLTRGAVAGVQRYGGQSWSGDIQSTWDSLRNEISGVVNYSAAGLPYFCTDTGGYHGFNQNDPDGREMYLRWLQFSTFNTIMRSHGTSVREPWQFGGTYEGYITDYINLRERLIPYIYSMAGAVTQDDYTMVRPLIFDFRTDDNVKNIKDQFMFGSNLMVCPIARSGQRTRSVYLPAGRWTNFWTGETIVSNGQTVDASAPLTQIPLFVRAGGIIPMGPENQYVDENQDPIELRVYMGADGQFTLYEDEGNNYNYEDGKFSTIPFTYSDATKTLTIGKRTGSFDGMIDKHTFKVVFVQPGYGTGEAISSEYQEGAIVEYDGSKAVTVTFDESFEPPIAPLDPENLPVPAAAPSTKVSQSAMVGCWNFNNAEGANVYDSSGYGNPGLLNNTGNWTQNGEGGKVGSAIQFTGDTFISVPSKDMLNMSTQLSFSAWVKNECNGYGNLLNKGGNGNNNPGYSFIISGSTIPQLEVQTKDGTKATVKATKDLPKDGQFHHVGFTWKSKTDGGDGIVRIYIDGQLASDETAANVFEGPIGDNTYPLILGRSCENEPDYPNYFKGIMDEVSLYNYELSSSEMKALSNLENILVANVGDASLQTGDGQMTVSWTDAASTTSVKVQVESVYPEISISPYDKTFTVEKGKQTLTISNLNNDEYYHVSIISIDEQGKESSGIYLLGYPSTQPVQIDEYYIASQGENVYGYIINRTPSPLNGTLTITLKDHDGKQVGAPLSSDITIGAHDSSLFKQQLDKTTYPFEAGQTMTFTLKNDKGELLSPIVTANRTALYTPKILGDKTQLEELLQFTIDSEESPYTTRSTNNYLDIYRHASKVFLDNKASEAEVRDVVAQLQAAREALRYNAEHSPSILAHFSQSEKTISTQLSGSIFYNDWAPADGVSKADQTGEGINCAGLATNGADESLHFRATVVFESVEGSTIDPGLVWSTLRFRFRSSNKDGEQACEFFTINSQDISSKNIVNIDVPLSEFQRAKIDWADLKELIVQCFVKDEYKLEQEGVSPYATFTMEDVWIESMGPNGWNSKIALEIALNSKLPAADLVGFTDESVANYNAIYQAAQAVYDNDKSTRNDLCAARLTLNNAENNLVKKENYQDPYLVSTLIENETTSREEHYLNFSETLNPAIDLTDYKEENLLLSYELRLNVTTNLPDITTANEWLSLVRNGRVQINGISIGGDQNNQIHVTKGELADMVLGNWVRVTVPLPQAIIDSGKVEKYTFFLYNDLHAYQDKGWQNDKGLTLSIRDVKIVKESTDITKTDLSNAIQSASTVLANGKAYTTDTKAALQTALATAQSILQNATATQTQVDEAVTALNTALAALRYAKGDVTGDGKLDVTDALIALQAAAGKITLTATETAAAHADGNAQNAVTAADALLILKAVTGQIAHF